MASPTSITTTFSKSKVLSSVVDKDDYTGFVGVQVRVMCVCGRICVEGASSPGHEAVRRPAISKHCLASVQVQESVSHARPAHSFRNQGAQAIGCPSSKANGGPSTSEERGQ